MEPKLRYFEHFFLHTIKFSWLQNNIGPKLLFQKIYYNFVTEEIKSYVKWQTSGEVVCYFCMYAVCEHEEVE